MVENNSAHAPLEELLAEFAAQADAWFQQRPFVREYHEFIRAFFQEENLRTAEWPRFQELGNHLHSFNSVALAKGNAFGRPNYPIEKYRESFAFLAHGPGSVEARMRAFLSDRETYASKYLGGSVVSELVGQLFAEKFLFMNRRDLEAVRFLGMEPTMPPGADFSAQFMAFNSAMEPLFKAYERLVGNRTGAPLGLEVDQFLSWVYETKLPKKTSSPEQQVPDGRQVWVIAPGPQGKFWEECLSKGIAVYGGDLLGPLDAFQSKEEILQQLKIRYPRDGEPTNDALAAWEFCRVMKEGDLILAKRGNRKILGLGTVQGPYQHDPSRAEYPNIRRVDWTHPGEWLLPDGESFATKALTNITKYKDFVAKILSTLDLQDAGEVLDAGQRYFWLNCAPDVWRVSQCSEGTEQTYTTHNEKGNKRQVYACFQAVRPGDLVIGYETTPEQKVTSILQITDGIHQTEREGECIRFKVLQHLKEPRSLQQLREVPSLANCGPVEGKRQGSLFQLTKTEYDAILSLGPGENVSEEDTGGTGEAYTLQDALDGLFVLEKDFSDWLKVWRPAKNLILQGPPGVGKTFVAKRLAYALMGTEAPDRIAMVQFHQSYGYEDFVQGYRPNVSGQFDLRNGAFYEFCLKAKESPRDQPFVFIIDEINRGNLSRIFGELLMLIEHDKRGEAHALRLANQTVGQSFFVPENVFILGMMNTADRSLAVVDYALRRRFRFASLMPAFGTVAFQDHLMGAGDESLARRITSKLAGLNKAIAEDVANLGPGFCVGHSYFCQVKSLDDYLEVVDFQIAPLLREYWFDTPKKAEEWIEHLRN